MVNWQNNETLTEVESSHGTLYSAKLCKYTQLTTRSVSKSNILKLNFVNYCTVQNPARNVLQLLYYKFISFYHYNEDTFFFQNVLNSHFYCPDDEKAAFFFLLPRSEFHLYTASSERNVGQTRQGIGTRRWLRNDNFLSLNIVNITFLRRRALLVFCCKVLNTKKTNNIKM